MSLWKSPEEAQEKDMINENLGIDYIDEEAVQKVINKSIEWNGKYMGMTYMQGIRDALEWILGVEDEPLEELPDRNPDFGK
jgi:hypothetical protein